MALVLVMQIAAAASPNAAIASYAEHWLNLQYQTPGSRVETQARPIDARLKLDDCAGAMLASLPQNIRPMPRMSVLVRCTAPAGWSVRVPVSLKIFRPVLVTSHPLMRGDGLGPGDAHTEERDITRLGYGYVADFTAVASRTLTHALPKNSVISPAALGGRQTVRAGDQVQLIADLGGIQVRADGVALGSGDRGSRLKVRNAGSGRVIDAVVTAPGVVQTLP